MTVTEADAIAKFKQFCEAEQVAGEEDKFDADEEQDWYSLSLGFFAALGFNSEAAHKMALDARYTYHYWH